MAVGAKSNNPQVGKSTTKSLKCISGGKISSLLDLHGNRQRLKVMRLTSKNVL